MINKLLPLFCMSLTLLVGCSKSSSTVYPAAPFQSVGSDFPEVIPLEEEPPESDQEGNDGYWEKRWSVHDYAMEESILQNAPQDAKELFEACWTGNYVTARRLADSILRTDPLSIVGLYGVAQVEAYAEGDLPYALHAVRQARRQAEALGSQDPSDRLGQEWYLRTLDLEYEILSSMDRLTEALVVVDRIEEVYGHRLPWRRAWPLMELGRNEEVRQVIAECIKNRQFPVHALNTLGAFEDRLHNRERLLALYRGLAQQTENGSVIWYNLGYAEAYAFEFDKAEAAFLKSATATDHPFDGTAYTPLSVLYLQQGRILEALDALKHAQEQRGERDACTLQQDEAEVNRAIAGLLLAMSEEEHALRFAKAAGVAPDRTGANNVSEQDWELTNGLTYWSILKCRAEEHREQGSYRRRTWQEQRDALAFRADQWRTRQNLRSWLNDEQLGFIIRPNVPGAAGFNTGVQSWQRLGLLEMVPSGVLAKALVDAREAEKDNPAAKPYLDAFEAGLMLQQRRYDGALRLAEDAWDDLNAKTEKILRAHVAAIAGQAAWEIEKPQKALEYWTRTVRDFPQAFRMLSIQLPISTQHDRSGLSSGIAKDLAGSTRFFADNKGFPIRIGQGGNKLSIEMFEPDATRLVELTVSTDDETLETTPANALDVRVIAAFYDSLFRPVVELTQADLGSLDGSPIAAKLGRQVDDLFADLKLAAE